MDTVKKSMILKDGRDNHLGEKCLAVLEAFIDNKEYNTNPQESFVSACLKEGLSGDASIILSSRLQCENVISRFLGWNKIDGEVNALDGRLMENKEKRRITLEDIIQKGEE